MKFFNNMLIIVALVATSTISLFGAGGGAGGQGGANVTRRNAAMTVTRLVERPVVVQPAEVSEVMPGADRLTPLLNVMMNYINKSPSQRTEKDMRTVKIAHMAFDNYLGQLLVSEEARLTGIAKSGVAQNALTDAIQQMVGSNWNMITNRPIMKSKYETMVLNAAVQALKQGISSEEIKNQLSSALSAKISNAAALNNYVLDLMAKTQVSAVPKVGMQGQMLEGPAAVMPMGSEDLTLEDLADINLQGTAQPIDWAAMRPVSKEMIAVTPGQNMMPVPPQLFDALSTRVARVGSEWDSVNNIPSEAWVNNIVPVLKRIKNANNQDANNRAQAILEQGLMERYGADDLDAYHEFMFDLMNRVNGQMGGVNPAENPIWNQ